AKGAGIFCQWKSRLLFIGLYELLVLSGYIFQNDSISPFLGSSFESFNFGGTVTNNIHAPVSELHITKMAKLLNQYLKRCSNKPWGYRCYNSFSKGLYPVVAVDFLNHPSQKYRHINIHHFASYILSIITSLDVTREKDVKCLWTLVERLPNYETIASNITPKPITFGQLKGLIRLLLTVAARTESHIPCYALGVYALSEAKETALQIMKNGHKEEIRKQESSTVNKKKAELI
ncbi:hypothetical protein AB4K20DRAFT_1995260, partial [Rhizopus microsporus]